MIIKSIHGIISAIQTSSVLSSTGLITYWDIQDASSYGGTGSTITDLDGTNNGLLVGSVPYTADTADYLSLDSTTSNYVRTTTNLNPHLSPANTSSVISVFTWVYPTSNGIILSEQGTTTPDSSWYDSQIEWISGTPNFAVWPYPGGIGGGGWVSSSVAAGLNAWHYVGFTYDGSTLRAYVNGVAAGSRTSARQTPYNTSSVGLYYTLGYPTNTDMQTNVGANFRLGAFHVWNIALSGAEVSSNYNATKTPYGH
jgi:hypothetical protein